MPQPPESKMDRLVAGGRLSSAYQQRIEHVRRRARRVDHTTYEAVLTANALPLAPDRDLARRFARQSALLHRFGQHREAVAAAVESSRRYQALPDLDDTERGYLAYSLLLVAEDLVERADSERALRPAGVVADLFARFRDQMSPHGVPDLVRARLTLARCRADLGMADAAAPPAREARREIELLVAAHGGPVGEPGSMPAGWGLPVVPTARQWRRLRRLVARTARRLGV
nr:hypothetical protein [Micromonospora sp. DSM 115978]